MDEQNEVVFGVEWGEAPPVKRNVGVWLDRLAPLVEHPGRPAKIAVGPYKKIQSHRSNLHERLYTIPEGNWLFQVRKIDEDQAGLWATYEPKNVGSIK
jgi:hypothetical protein